ncbi:transposase [Soehngenia saccharolytica]|nr:transposase [Soehngenia saccharolytica]
MRQVNQQVLKMLCNDWKSFYKAIKDYNKNPSSYTGRPKPPKYSKKNGRKKVSLSNQICKIKDNKYLRFPKTKLQLNIGKLGKTSGKLMEVRIVPCTSYYELEIVFEVAKEKPEPKETNRVIGIDLGIDNFVTIANNVGLRPTIIKGKIIKSINQYYNKKRAYYMSMLRQGKAPGEGVYYTKRLNRLDEKRNSKIKDFIHKTSRVIINYAIDNDIDTIIIGKNEAWKKNVNIGKANNQKFVAIPYKQLIEMIQYKAIDNNIKVIVTEESYTSKASFLDYDLIPKYGENKNITYIFSGKRVKRGLYRTSTGLFVNADVNGAYNVILKVIPEAFSLRDRGLVTSPQLLSVA